MRITEQVDDFVDKIDDPHLGNLESRIQIQFRPAVVASRGIGHFDEQDIRSRVPVSSPVRFVASQLKPSGPDQEAEAQITNDPSVPQEQQIRGRTPVWQNIEH